MNTLIDRRVFVVGVPRSGTTLVQSLLAAHSKLTSFTESHFFDRHFRLLPWSSSPILTRDPRPRLHDFLAENGAAESAVAARISEQVRAAVPAGFLLPFETRSVARQLVRALDELALDQGMSSWVEKTPRHLRYVPFLERLIGSGRRTCFVHVIRDGLEAVASLHTASRSWERTYDLAACVERWNSDVGFSLARVSEPNDHFVFYERLTSKPEATLERLISGLGLDWEPEILERYGQTSARLITREEAWKSDISRSVRSSGTSESALTQEQREKVTEGLRSDLYTRLLERASA